MNPAPVQKASPKRFVPTAQDKELWNAIKREVEGEREKAVAQPRTGDSTTERDYEHLKHMISNYHKCRLAARRRRPSRARLERTIDILAGDDHEWEVRQAAAESLVSWRSQRQYLLHQEVAIAKQRLLVIYRERERARLQDVGWTMLKILHPTYISKGIWYIEEDR